MQVFMESGKLYTSPLTAPFSVTQYTPFYYYLCSLTAWLTGHSDNSNIQALYTIGRSWNLIFNLINAIFIFKISRSVLSISKNKSYFLSLLSFALISTLGFAVRPDSLCDMASIASIYCFLIYQKEPKDKFRSIVLLGVTVLLTAIAVFSKQSGIQLIIIFGGFCLLIKDFKTLIRIILFTIVFYGGLLWLFSHLYDSFFQNIIGGVANGINLKWFMTFIIGRSLFVISCWPLILISLFLLIKKNTLFKGDICAKLLAFCMLGTLTFAMVTALKMGSNINYFMIFINLSLIFTAKNIGNKEDVKSLSFNEYFGYKEFSFFLYFFLIAIVYGLHNYKLILKSDYDPKLEQQRNAAINTAEFIENDMEKDSKKYIFANLTTAEWIPSRQRINNILFKNCLVPQMDILEYSTGPSKVMGYKNLEKMFNTGQVEYIIESEPKFAFSILSNLESIKNSKFKLIKNIDGYLIYKLNRNE
jgi:hypothetical protein